MISFRYHLVSIVAVFVALAIGIVAGSTVVQQTIVENTKQNLKQTDANLRAVQRENDRLSALVDGFDKLGGEGASSLLAGRLSGAPVVLVEAPGVQDRVNNGVVNALHASNAEFVGRVVFSDASADPSKSSQLAEALDLPDAPLSELRRVLGDRVATQLEVLSRAVVVAPRTSTAASTTTAADQRAPQRAPADVLLEGLGSLNKGGELELRDFAAELNGTGPLTLVVLQDRASPSDGTAVLTELLRQLAHDRPGGLRVIGAESAEPPASGTLPTASLVGAVRAQADLNAIVSTVDDAERFTGWAGIVLAAAEQRSGGVGHYGVRPGSSGVLPAPAPA